MRIRIRMRLTCLKRHYLESRSKHRQCHSMRIRKVVLKLPGFSLVNKDAMAPYYPLYIRRSDGKFQIKAHGKPETNEPTSEQLDQSPNAQGVCDFYRICKADDPKLLDWRRKLGGMLIRELQAKEEVNQCKQLQILQRTRLSYILTHPSQEFHPLCSTGELPII